MLATGGFLLDLFYMEINKGSERISDLPKAEQLSLVHNSKTRKISKNLCIILFTWNSYRDKSQISGAF